MLKKSIVFSFAIWPILTIVWVYFLGHAHIAYSYSFVEHVDQIKEGAPVPWFTGPLLSPSGIVTPTGHYNIEPTQYTTAYYGIYDAQWRSHSTTKFYTLTTRIPVQIGFLSDFDFDFTPSWSWNHDRNGPSHWTLNDMKLGVDYQLVLGKKEGFCPSIKLALSANLPIGNYQNLNPNANGTDIGGTGSWIPRIALNFSHLFWWGGHVFFAPRFQLQYIIPTQVHVRGYNTYGGGRHTAGKVTPGQSFVSIFGFEISLSQRFVIAGDIEYQHINKTRFKGQAGSTNNILNQTELPSGAIFTLAPAIEYNWSRNCGIIAGVWFSVAGRHMPEFASGVIAINIYR